MTTKHLNKSTNSITGINQSKAADETIPASICNTAPNAVSNPTPNTAPSAAPIPADNLTCNSTNKPAGAPTNKMRTQLTKNRPNHQNTHKSFRKSENAIHHALHQEMSTRHSQISVTEFCHIAKISTFTFYTHYKSIREAFISYELEIQNYLKQMLVQLGILDDPETPTGTSNISSTPSTSNATNITSTTNTTNTPSTTSTSTTSSHPHTTSPLTKTSPRELLFTCVLSTIRKYRTYFSLSFRNHDFFLLHKLIQIIAPYLTNQHSNPTTLTLYYSQLAAVITCWAMHDNFSTHKTTLYTHRLTRVRLVTF